MIKLDQLSVLLLELEKRFSDVPDVKGRVDGIRKCIDCEFSHAATIRMIHFMVEQIIEGIQKGDLCAEDVIQGMIAISGGTLRFASRQSILPYAVLPPLSPQVS